jgi:hypothetical protein
VAAPRLTASGESLTLTSCGVLCGAQDQAYVLCSEENDAPIVLDSKTGGYAVVFDPVCGGARRCGAAVPRCRGHLTAWHAHCISHSGWECVENVHMCVLSLCACRLSAGRFLEHRLQPERGHDLRRLSQIRLHAGGGQGQRKGFAASMEHAIECAHVCVFACCW